MPTPLALVALFCASALSTLLTYLAMPLIMSSPLVRLDVFAVLLVWFAIVCVALFAMRWAYDRLVWG